MAKSASVVIPSVFPQPIGVPAAHRFSTGPLLKPFHWLNGLLTRFRDRIQAKIAFHDPDRYRALVNDVIAYAGTTACESTEETPLRKTPYSRLGPLVRKLRKLDPHGLGVWYLARGGPQPGLADLCRNAIGLPCLGPPRAIARALERTWSGEASCLFGESAGFDPLMAATLICAGHAATLVAAHLASPDGPTSLAHAANQLTRTASAVQSAGRAYARAGRAGHPAQETTRWLFQAVNLLRRALNHTDLMAVDEQIARESARESLSAATTACAAALTLSADLSVSEAGGEGTSAREKLAALARTADALASRVAASLRADADSVASQNFLVEQSARLLGDATKSLRPWHITLPCGPTIDNSGDIQGFCTHANDLAEASGSLLESWGVLHELCSTDRNQSGNSAETGALPRPMWAERLIRTVGRQWTCQDIVSAIRTVSGRSEHAVAAAVELSALHSGSLQLSRELWRLIRTSRCTPLERSLAFQLYLRTGGQ